MSLSVRAINKECDACGDIVGITHDTGGSNRRRNGNEEQLIERSNAS